MTSIPPNPEPRLWKRAGAAVLDLLYPSGCALCETSLAGQRFLCDDCGSRLPRLEAPFCDTCGEMFQGRIDGAFTCPHCRDLRFAFRFARPAMVRDDSTLDLVHRLKYGREPQLAIELGRLAAEAFADSRLAVALANDWPLVPVPLHRSRLRQRHFNQAEEIALALSKHTDLPVVNALRRIRRTETQTRLTRKQRMENLRGAFAPARELEGAVPGAVLVDDVFTTGSTVNECAKTLRKAGVAEVVVVTVMRG